MAAFDRILSGIPEMDRALDNIRLGDNVVWRVSDLAEFHLRELLDWKRNRLNMISNERISIVK